MSRAAKLLGIVGIACLVLAIVSLAILLVNEVAKRYIHPLNIVIQSCRV